MEEPSTAAKCFVGIDVAAARYLAWLQREPRIRGLPIGACRPICRLRWRGGGPATARGLIAGLSWASSIVAGLPHLWAWCRSTATAPARSMAAGHRCAR
jgi:hypothetical protein